MPCDKITYQLEAFVDGECGADDQKMISDHLEHCAACSQRVDDLRQLNDAMAAGLGTVKAPADLWQRIEARLPESLDDHRQPPGTRPWFRQPIWQTAIAASLLIMLAVPAGLTWRWVQPDNSVIAAPIQDFSTYRDSGRNLDIASKDPEVVRSWFASRLTFEAPQLESKVAGFDLIGGRLCWLLDRRLGAFAYQRGDQTVALYVMTDHDLVLPDNVFDPELGIAVSSHELDGLRTMIWRANDLVYTVVSDMPKQDMSIFLAALARTQVAPSDDLARRVTDHGRMDKFSSVRSNRIPGEEA